MAKKLDIEAGARAFSEDLRLPGGRQKKLARVVERHLLWFDAAEAQGLTWDDMIAVLAAAGAKRKNGLPLSRGTLSSAVWRKRAGKSVEKKRTSVATRSPVDKSDDEGPPSQAPQPRDSVRQPEDGSSVLSFMRRAAAGRRRSRSKG